LRATTPAIVMSTQGWIPLLLGATGLAPRWGMLVLPAAAAFALAVVLAASRAPPPTWFAAVALAIAALSPLCWNPNYVLAFPALVLVFERASGGGPLRKWAAIGSGLAAAALLTALTPGIVSVATYQHVLWTYRPYAWLSLALLVALLLGRGGQMPWRSTSLATVASSSLPDSSSFSSCWKARIARASASPAVASADSSSTSAGLQ
jgi:hypothetical protein